MSSRPLPRAACALVVPFALAAAASAQSRLSLPTALQEETLPLEQVDLLALPALDLATVQKEDLHRDEEGLPFRFAIPHDVVITPQDMGTWETLPGGDLLWRLRIEAPGAKSLNVGFSQYEMPEGGVLWVYSTDERFVLRPFTAADNEEHGQLWTPVLLSDAIVVELTLPPSRLHDLKLEMQRVGYGYRGWGSPAAYQDSYQSGSCNVDVVCPEGDPWALEIPAVGALQISGFLNCSGSLLNDANDSLTPYYLTANHCGVTSGTAASVVVYWNYQNSFCRPPFSGASGSAGDGTLGQFNAGSIFRAAYAPSDFTLVELDDPIDPAFHVSWAGWNRQSQDFANATAIHHPGVQEKRISFEFDPTTTTSYLGEPVPGDGTHIRITDWDVGTTEGGSSGSPLFDPNHRVVGQLHGGFASCSSQTSDWYGRLSVSWNGGGTPSTRLKDWLDPGNTGVLFVDTISLDTLCSDAGEADFTGPVYACEGTADVLIVDCGLDTDENVVEVVLVDVSSDSEPGGEPVLCTETGPGSGRFLGTAVLSSTDAAGVLHTSPGDTLTVTYVDADDGMGGSGVVVTGTAATDCVAPSVTGVTVVNITSFGGTVRFGTNEPTTATVHYGTSCGNLTGSASTSNLTTQGALALSGLQDDTTYFFDVTVTDAAGNSTTVDNGGACYSFHTLPAPEYFTEQFLNDFDLDHTTILFTPIGGPDGYEACISPSAGLPTDPTGGTVHTLTDDGTATVALAGGATVPFYGVAKSTVYVCSNGYVTFNGVDGDYDETLAEHFEFQRVAALYDDLNPSAGGSVSTKQLGDRFAITWLGVPEYNTTNSNTFQIELFFDGRITITWNGTASLDSIVGLSRGTLLQPDFAEENLSALPSCSSPVCQVDLGFGGPGSAVLSMCGGDLSTGTTADLLLTGAPAGTTAYLVGSTSFLPSNFKGGTLVPIPIILLAPLPTDGSGEILIANVPGGGGPATIYLQYVIVDPSQLLGFGLSNALQVDYLP